MKKIWFLLVAAGLIINLSGCSKDDPDPNDVAFENASISKGGILYDKFWAAESGYDSLNPNIQKFNAYADFFRCKQCHGWDLYGSNGYYNNRAAKKSRPNVSNLNIAELAKQKSHAQLFEVMKTGLGRRDISYDLANYDPISNPGEGDKMPNYSQILTDAQIWDLVKFMKAGAFNVDELYDATYNGTYPTGSTIFSNIGKNGDAVKGNAYYAANCTLCHGVDGKKIPLEGISLGKFFRTKPNEVQHKIKYGQLGTAMTGKFEITIAEMKDLYKACSNSNAYPD